MVFTITSSQVPADLEEAARSLWIGLYTHDTKSVKKLLGEDVRVENGSNVYQGKDEAYSHLMTLSNMLGLGVSSGLHIAMVKKKGFEEEKLLIWYTHNNCYLPNHNISEVQVWDWLVITENKSTTRKVAFMAAEIFGPNEKTYCTTFVDVVTNYDEINKAKKLEINTQRCLQSMHQRRSMEKHASYQASDHGFDFDEEHGEKGRRGCIVS